MQNVPENQKGQNRQLLKQHHEAEHKARRLSGKFCPKCGSTNVYFASGLPQLWSVWDCRNCGYRGSLILEDGRLAVRLRREYESETGKH